MSAIADGAMWVGIWLAAGFVLGVIATMAMLANRVDARAKNLSKAAHEISRINPRGRDMSPEEFADAAARQGYHVIRPVSSTPQGDLGD
jgi:hypothetical protein